MKTLSNNGWLKNQLELNKSVMKSNLFKTAWKLKKELQYSFSDALKLFWKAFKNQINIIVNISWKGIKSISFSKRIDNITYTRGSFEDLLRDIKTHVPFDNSGAQIYYDGLTFNND